MLTIKDAEYLTKIASTEGFELQIISINQLLLFLYASGEPSANDQWLALLTRGKL